MPVQKTPIRKAARTAAPPPAARKIVVEIDGKKYPCYQTMGALMLLESETGKSADQCTTMTDQVTFLWACCKSASRREGIAFDYSVEDFADNITPDDLFAWASAQAATAADKPEDPKNA